jgi:MFS transporter, Spinster family, sphingosine-1-phosphate transporter
VDQRDLQPRTALAVLTALNLLNYVDRNVLFAVQPLIQAEFHVNKEQIGYLTSAFLGFYMIAAPFVGPLADRYSRKLIIVLGAIFWSGLTLLTAVTHNYTELLIRHTLVGVGEATFVTIAPTFVADLFEENKRGRILGIFYLAIPVGSAAGYLLGGYLAPHHGWRFPFYIAAAPGFILAIAASFLSEPERGLYDTLTETPERATVLGFIRNPAFLTSTLGMAAMTYSLGGIQVWMPQFLYSERHYTLESANFMFGIIIVIDGVLAALAGGWLGDYLLPRMKSSYYFVSAVSMALGVPIMIVALFVKGPLMVPAIAVAAFFLLFNTAPLNAAVINSVGGHIRATALAVNIFIIHLLGDVPSPTMMGWVADRHSLQTSFILPIIAMAISSAILFYGMKFAPPIAVNTAQLRAAKS